MEYWIKSGFNKDLYRGMALSSLFSKIFDHCIISCEDAGLLYTTGTESFLYTHANAVKDGRHGNNAMGENYKCIIYLYRVISINQISIL